MGIRSIPWWGKIGAKIVLSRLPIGYGIWQRMGLFRHGEMDRSPYALEVFDLHARRGKPPESLRGKVIMELGPGDSLATAVVAAAHGARAILVDSGDHARKDMRVYRDLANHLAAKDLKPPSLDDCRDTTELLARCSANYITDGLAGLRRIQADSVDVIFSHAVLEHVRKHEFLETMRECYRILAAGGFFSNQVDLKDHLGGSLNNLRFSKKTWESDLFTRSGFYTNRIRYAEMLRLFGEAGFKTESLEPQSWPKLPINRDQLDDEFRNLPEEDLVVSQFSVLLQKSAG